MCLFMAPSGRMRSGSMIFIIAAGWWPFRGLSRIWTPWTLPLHARRVRGGSHVHVYSPNGQFVSFTYNDHVLHKSAIRRWICATSAWRRPMDR